MVLKYKESHLLCDYCKKKTWSDQCKLCKRWFCEDHLKQRAHACKVREINKKTKEGLR